jgi:hypothetical protein
MVFYSLLSWYICWLASLPHTWKFLIKRTCLLIREPSYRWSCGCHMFFWKGCIPSRLSATHFILHNWYCTWRLFMRTTYYWSFNATLLVGHKVLLFLCWNWSIVFLMHSVYRWEHLCLWGLSFVNRFKVTKVNLLLTVIIIFQDS